MKNYMSPWMPNILLLFGFYIPIYTRPNGTVSNKCLVIAGVTSVIAKDQVTGIGCRDMSVYGIYSNINCNIPSRAE